MLALLGEQIAHVVGQPGDAEQSGLLVQQAVDFGDREAMGPPESESIGQGGMKNSN